MLGDKHNVLIGGLIETNCPNKLSESQTIQWVVPSAHPRFARNQAKLSSFTYTSIFHYNWRMLAHVKTPQRHIPPTKENPLGKVVQLWGDIDGGSCSNLLKVITQKGTSCNRECGEFNPYLGGLCSN